MDKKKIFNILILVGIMCVAIWLRLLYINTDFWYDEACSWFSAIQSFPYGIMDNLLKLDLQHTPLYFFLLHFWMKLFGQNEIPMRVLSLIFGLATVPLVYTAAKKLSTDLVAKFAASVAAVSPLLVLFSVEVRMYPVVTFLVMLSLNYLIDFEQKRDLNSLIKLVIANVLIPYTLVGGILYNISLFVCYAFYLFKNKKDVLFAYLKAALAELVLLIPYFCLIAYYAKERSIFVISHEGELQFFNVVDVIRNFFGASLTDNVYWPSVMPYKLTLLFAIIVIVPCVYFVLGFIKGRKTDNNFLKTLYNVFFVSFCLSVVFALFKVNVLTVRYILYLLPPLFILSIIGLFKGYSEKHCKIFLSIFILLCINYCTHDYLYMRHLKTISLKTVRLEADALNLGVDDLVIMPFAGDAPYYFRDLTSPRVFDFDFHKQARNPYNNNFYDKRQQEDMAGDLKYRQMYFSVMSNDILSQNFKRYFIENVNMTVPSKRYVLLAMYGTDANYLVPIQDLKNSITLEYDVEKDMLGVMFKKTLCDMRAMLDADFNYIKSYQKDNYTFLLYQKK